jgi:hypothetical protein
LLDEPAAVAAFVEVCQRVAQGNIPETAAHALSISKLVAPQKPSGGARGLVVGDFLRRLVARTQLAISNRSRPN